MHGVYDQLIRLTARRRQAREDLAENGHVAQVDEAVVDRLGGTIIGRRIVPAQAVANDKYDTADNAVFINPWNAMRKWEIGPYLSVSVSPTT